MGFRNTSTTVSGRSFSRSLAIGLLGLAMVLGIVTAYVPKTEAAVGQYVKYSWSDRVYRVYGGVTIEYVTWAKYVAAGYPPVSTVNWIPGTKVVRYLTNSDEIYARLPDLAEGHHLSWNEWGAMGYPTPAKFYAGFIRVNNGPAVYRVPSCTGIGLATAQLSFSEWGTYGYPNTVNYGYIPRCIN